MILPFSTQHDGRPNQFIERIWEGIFRYDLVPDPGGEMQRYEDLHKAKFGKSWDYLREDPRLEYPKIHSIRQDFLGRWKPGAKIDFAINNRSENYFSFAPKLPVISIQPVGLMRLRGNVFIKIGSDILTGDIADQFIKQDGFDTPEDFYSFFQGRLTEGVVTQFILIHWTNFKY